MDCLWSKHPWRCHAIFPWNGPEAEVPRVQALKGSDNSKTFHVWFRLDRIHVHAAKHQGHHKRRATVLQCTSLETARHPAYIMSWLFFARSTNDYAKHLQTMPNNQNMEQMWWNCMPKLLHRGKGFNTWRRAGRPSEFWYFRKACSVLRAQVTTQIRCPFGIDVHRAYNMYLYN